MPEGNGLVCFLSQNRLCGPDCMAWSAPPEGAEFKDQQWANCMVLTNVHRTGKHLVVLASVAANIVRAMKISDADQQRANQPPPPVVR